MEENKELIKVQEELEKLDRDYFHTYTEVDENNNIKWSVYYKNMNDKDYFKISNRPILNSINNNLNDIEKLSKEFEKVKEKAKENMYWEKFVLSIDMFEFRKNIYDYLQKMMDIPSFSILGLIIFLFILNINSRIFAIIGLSLMTIFSIITLTINYVIDNIEKQIDELQQKEEDRILKAYLKDKDMKGLNYEFTKKNRTKSIKENKEYRPKRKRLQPGMERLEGIQKTSNKRE